MKQITVLGCGMVGSAMVKDLSKNFKVTVADYDAKTLEEFENYKNVQTFETDLSEGKKISNLVKTADYVVNAVPGSMGFKTLKEIIKAGKDVVDISFFAEDAFELQKLAEEKNVTVITDAGVAPGMSNMICGYHDAISELTEYKCYVGGLPFQRKWPHNYKAPFSPSDVIEEYTRPARYVQSSKEVVREALSEREYLNFDKVGTLEAFNTDGLRTLIKTMNIPNMIEKTMRYPGTAEYMQVLREMGFFSKEFTEVNGQKVRPLDLTSKLLFKDWKLGKEEKEFTLMRVIIGTKDETVTYDLYDVFDEETGISFMSRTTGYTCTAVVNLLSDGVFTKKGLFPPELVGAKADSFQYILNYLKDRGVVYEITKEDI